MSPVLKKLIAGFAATKAFELRHRLTDIEAANAEGYYYQSGPGRSRARVAPGRR